MSDQFPYATRSIFPTGMSGGGRQPSAARMMLAARLAANGHAKPFGMLSGEQILSGLSDEQRADLAKALQPKSAKAHAEAIRAQAFKEAAARQSQVMASDHYLGNEKLAATLLAHAQLSVGEIITALAAAPKPKAIDPQLAEDDRLAAERADMRAQLDAAQSDNSGANADDSSLVDAMRARWADVHAEIAAEREL